MVYRFVFTYFVDFKIYEGVLEIPDNKYVSDAHIICAHDDIKLNLEHALSKYAFRILLDMKKINLYKDSFKGNVYFCENKYFWKSNIVEEIVDKNYIINNSDKIKDWEKLTKNINSQIIVETIDLLPWNLICILKKDNMNQFLLLDNIKDEYIKETFINLMKQKLNEY